MTFNYSDYIKRFDLRNNNLAVLASEVAIDIENNLNGKYTGDEPAKDLSKFFEEITFGEKPLVLLPDNAVVLGYAISSREKFEEYWKGKSDGELVLQINLAAKDLRDFKSISKEQQKRLFEFCINLSREVIHHYDEFYSRNSRLVA